MTALEAHPAAAVWPMLPEPDLRRLADDITENGLRHPIVLDAAGRVLDGRNRLAACRIAGFEPTFETYEGDAVAYVLSQNDERRHMSLPERAAARALTLATEGGHRENGRWKRGSVSDSPDTDSSTSSGTWAMWMSRAGLVLDHLPDLLVEVAAGKLALDAAYNEARDEKRRRDQIGTLPGDLAALVESGHRTLTDALTEATHRETVHTIDKIRDGDGAPRPSFAERVENGSITWTEAVTLAEEWQQERAESINRNVTRLCAVVSGWAAVQTLRESIDSPYSTEVIGQLSPTDRNELSSILNTIGK